MRFLRGTSRILWYESFGFLLLIGVSWISNTEGLSQKLFGGAPHRADWRDSALQTLVIIYVWAIVWGLTRTLIERVNHLRRFLRLCAWCRKVGHDGQWMRIEEYFRQDFQIPTTHGMCPDCKKRMYEETTEFVRKETERRAQARAEDEPGSTGVSPAS
jgi:hypothetical protein